MAPACERCGSPVSTEASSAGLCPRCLIGFALIVDSGEPVGEEARAARFLPGDSIADRYRIIGLLGRGGMGEVYAADDLRLGQRVALKFLPRAMDDDPVRAASLRNEVRLARLVSHPNVCRVFDLGEVDGLRFVAMEFVDGENLRTLLRRIGRLPRDKAVQLARQLCEGLAAAHDRGVLHRDIKPANVMIDGRGRVRITDFGLARPIETERGSPGSAGTPAYMAPELFHGAEPTTASDVYGLGLVLYELFTGHTAFPPGALASSPHDAADATPPTPSEYLPGIDPAIERAILGCLEYDPRRRFASPRAVLTALPGGDPLAAALAAGKTPGPDVVAGAGASGGLRPWIAWTCLLATLAGFAAVIVLAARTQITRVVPLPTSVEALAERARQVRTRMGYDEPPADRTYGFGFDRGYLDHLFRQGRPPNLWSRLASDPSAIWFWYRESPGELVRHDLARPGISEHDPPMDLPGMLRLRLDPSGRLLRFEAVPPPRTEPDPGSEPDWASLFDEAGLDPGSFEPVEPVWTPGAYGDRRAAWERGEVRVEAAALGGRPVDFRVLHPWGPASASHAVPPTPIFHDVRPAATTTGTRVRQAVYVLCLVVGVPGAWILARRNLARKRGHRTGATRLAVYLGVLGMLIWVLGAHHVASVNELRMITVALATTLLWSLLAWVLYIAVEPYLRAVWPETLISWVRLLEGRLRDPLVGRHVLSGCLLGVAIALCAQAYQVLPPVLGMAPPRIDLLNAPANELEALRSLRSAVATTLTVHWKQLFYVMLYVCMLVLMRLALRRTGFAIAAAALIAVVSMNPHAGNLWADLAVGAIIVGLATLAFFRFGLLCVVVALTVAYLPGALTLTIDLQQWYWYTSFSAMALAVGLALYGFFTSLAGRPAFGEGSQNL